MHHPGIFQTTLHRIVIMQDRMPTIVCEMLSLGAVLEQHAVEGIDLSSVAERREMAQIAQDSLV